MKIKISRRFFFKKLTLVISYLAYFPKSFAKNKIFYQNITKNSDFGDEISICFIELKTGNVLSSFNEEKKLPLASVTKALTASYALETLGKNYNFKTSINFDGKKIDDIIYGNLYLVGGADPSLTVDHLYELALSLKKKGIKDIKGKFFVDDTIINSFPYIDKSQPPEASYNPGLSGLNLSQNKVFFKWKKNLNFYDLNLFVGGNKKKYSPKSINIFLKENQESSFTHEYNMSLKVENWKVLSSILNESGGRWLPVRLTSIFTSHIFFSICKDIGINISYPIFKKSPKKTKEITSKLSVNLNEILKKMLKRSTNVTAEIVGIFAARLWGIKINSINESGKLMSAWFNIVNKSSDQIFLNHSGLSSESKVSSKAFSRFLSREETKQNLLPILNIYRKNNEIAKNIKNKKIRIVAKTGTMFFIRGLAGYIIIDEKPFASFTILFANSHLRMKIKSNTSVRPKGSKNWLYRSKILERKIIENLIQDL